MNFLEDKPFSSLNSANIFSGMVFGIVSVASFVIIYRGATFPFDSIIADLLPLGVVSLIADLSLVGIISFIIGFFIQGIRYLGFKYHMKLRDKAREKAEKKEKEKVLKKEQKQAQEEEKEKEEEHLGIWQNIITYLFRKGTVTDVCINTQEHDPAKYPWLQDSQQPVKDMWLYANKIRKIAPEENVYGFYYWSETFQCLDTTFVFLGIGFFICCIINTLVRKFMGECFQITIPQIIIPGIFALLSLVFHKVSKACAGVYAERFLFAIDKGITGNGIELRK
jgi:hypothetical protein